MKTALITTTINIPKVLELYRAHSEDVMFFVAMDKKSPTAAFELCNAMENCEALGEHGHYWKCSELIGWNTIARRNIAMLEALKWGAECLITVDDDNAPIDSSYFKRFQEVLSQPFSGIKATSKSGWFDSGQLLEPTTPQRGFSHVTTSAPTYSYDTKRSVGVATGICLGSPDCSAVSRIANDPLVHRVSELCRAGVIVDPAGERRPERVTDEQVTTWRATTRGTWTIFNSQVTALVRELAPAFFMIPQFKRFDDILGSLIVQRIMREKGYVTYHGSPFVFQERNEHDLLKDLAAEQWGSERVVDFAAWLDGFVFTGRERVTDCMRIMYHNLPDWMPERNKIEEMVFSFCSDCDEVMK